MNCQDVNHLLDSGSASPVLEQAGLGEHLRVCQRCGPAWHAAMMLRRSSELPEPDPRSDLMNDVLRVVGADRRPAGLRASSFGLGSLFGAAAAAAVVVVMLTILRPASESVSESSADLMIALHQTRAVTLAIDSAENLTDARIHVALTGGIELEGMPGRRDIQWTTSLEAGINRLSLPVTALVDDDAEIRVEVEHGNKRRLFLLPIDIVDDARSATLG
jgi:hypothetical protein